MESCQKLVSYSTTSTSNQVDELVSVSEHGREKWPNNENMGGMRWQKAFAPVQCTGCTNNDESGRAN